METTYTSTAYLWFDTEYTGLDLQRANLLQVAMVITDADLRRMGPPGDDISLFLRLPEGAPVSPWIEENMPDVLAQCRSGAAVSLEEADRRLADCVSRHVVVQAGEDKRRPILAGNSIHADWFLAAKFLPKFSALLHYRHLDVTALKLQWQDWIKGEAFDKDRAELVRRHFPEFHSLGPDRRHDAYYDAQASIAELAFYRSQLHRT
jgi:oligoribonuclease